ncbi:MAG: enoyl-CoA hydratase/isomerase family protein [Spirochaetia bacterium]|nr:enoyl-CoA hydratase/isomerase family protein [Spirochaetia bacterium]
MMEKTKYLEIEIKKQTAVIYLNREKENSLNIEFMGELEMAHRELNANGSVRAVILTSREPGFFSNGLDIHVLLNSGISGKIHMFEALFNMSRAVYSFEKIHVCLMNGHAMAGGAILAAMSDFRFMANGPYRVSFSEVKLGLAIPPLFIKIIQSITGGAALNKTVLQGKAFKPAEALQTGFVDDIFPQEDALFKTEKFVHALLQSPPQSYTAVKQYLRKDMIHQFEADKAETLQNFSRFFNDNFTEALLAISGKRRPVFSDNKKMDD